MHDTHHRLSSSKSLGQMPPVRYNRAEPPSTSALPSTQHRSRDRVSISNLINAVDNARITSVPSSPVGSSPSPLSIPDGGRDSNRQRRSSRVRANSAQGARSQAQLDELAARRKKIQSEKKRLWRKNLSPDQKAKRQELDAQRKREQRLNMTPDQRAEARRKDAARKAAKRRLQKEQQLRAASSSSSSSPPPFLHNQHTPLSHLPDSSSRANLSLTSPSSPVDYDSAAFSRSKIQDLLN